MAGVEGFLQIPIFLVVAVCYRLIILATLDSPFVLLGWIWGRVARAGPQGPRGLEVMMRLEGVVIAIGSLAIVAALARLDLWDMSWVKVWESPLMLCAVPFYLVNMARHSESLHAGLRARAGSAVWGSLGMLALLAGGALRGNLIWEVTFRAGVAVAALVIGVDGIYTLFRLAPRSRRFAELVQRHESLGKEFVDLVPYAQILGDPETVREVLAAMTYVTDGGLRAQGAVKRDQLDEADAILVDAEAEVARLSRALHDWFLLSLPYELDVRLQQAEREVETLRKDFSEACVSPEALDSLLSDINALTSQIPELDPEAEDFAQQIQPFLKVFRQIVDIRMALRFRSNVGATIDRLVAQVQTGGAILDVGARLGLSATAAKQCQAKVMELLSGFTDGGVTSSEELVRDFQALQRAAVSLEGLVKEVSSAIDRGWKSAELDAGRVRVYVPYVCDTTRPSQAAFSVSFEGDLQESVSFDLDGTLLELPAERTVVVEGRSTLGREHRVEVFALAGRKGGMATLTVHVAGVKEDSDPLQFDIRVRPSTVEMAQGAVVYGLLFGAAVCLAVWFGMKREVQDAGALGAALGSVAGLIVFVANWLRRRTSY